MSVPGTEIWIAVADAFERLRGRSARDLWLSHARPVSFRRGLFTLDVGNVSAKAAIDARYRGDLESLFRQLTGSPVRVLTRVGESDDAPGRRGDPTGNHDPAGNGSARERMGLGAHEPGAAAPGPAVEPLCTWPARCVRNGANELAYDAVQRFVLAPDAGFNPLFVYGPAGSGKTELGRFALSELRGAADVRDPLVVSGEILARDVYRAIRAKDLGGLQRQWSRHDMLLLDEAHRLRGQRRAQAETVGLIDGILGRGGRVLVLSRHAPHDVHGVDERLASHFLRGMVVPVGEPDTSDRRAVLEQAGASLAMAVGDGVADAIAARCPGNLTDAVGLLGRLAAEAAAEGGTVDLVRVRRHLDRSLPGAAGMDALLDAVCSVSGVDVARIRSAEKSREVAGARHLVVYLATRSLGLSARQVCRHLGLRSPSVAAYARRQVERRRHNDAGFDRQVHELQGRLEGAQRDLSWP